MEGNGAEVGGAGVGSLLPVGAGVVAAASLSGAGSEQAAAPNATAISAQTMGLI